MIFGRCICYVEAHASDHSPPNCLSHREKSRSGISDTVESLTKEFYPVVNAFKRLKILLDLSDDLLKTAANIEFSNSCLEAYSRMVYCPVCGSIDNFQLVGSKKQKYRGCTWFCWNVMRGCMVPNLHLQTNWRKLMIKLSQEGRNLGDEDLLQISDLQCQDPHCTLFLNTEMFVLWNILFLKYLK